MLIKKEETKAKANSKSCTVWEYPFPSKDFGFATAEINGRYPDEGAVVNEMCHEIYYVLGGQGKIYCEGKECYVKEG